MDSSTKTSIHKLLSASSPELEYLSTHVSREGFKTEGAWNKEERCSIAATDDVAGILCGFIVIEL